SRQGLSETRPISIWMNKQLRRVIRLPRTVRQTSVAIRPASGVIIGATSGGRKYGAALSEVDQASIAAQAGRRTMGNLPGPLAYLLLFWVVITAALVALLIYRAVLSTREDDQIYLNKAEVSMMAGEQQ